jgi:hypothetical protein
MPPHIHRIPTGDRRERTEMTKHEGTRPMTRAQETR